MSKLEKQLRQEFKIELTKQDIYNPFGIQTTCQLMRFALEKGKDIKVRDAAKVVTPYVKQQMRKFKKMLKDI